MMSGCPILSCDILTATTDDDKDVLMLLGVFGDTAGVVSVWLLSGSVLPRGPQGGHQGGLQGGLQGPRGCVLEKSRLLFEYNAHSMGANTVSMVSVKPTSIHSPSPSSLSSAMVALQPVIPLESSSPSTVTSITPTSGTQESTTVIPPLYSHSWGVFIASGGDDQAITCCSATLTASLSGGVLAVNISSSHLRADGCSGSAIKGVKVITLASERFPVGSHKGGIGAGDLLISSVGYDQRLSVWRPTAVLLTASHDSHTQVLISDDRTGSTTDVCDENENKITEKKNGTKDKGNEDANEVNDGNDRNEGTMGIDDDEGFNDGKVDGGDSDNEEDEDDDEDEEDEEEEEGDDDTDEDEGFHAHEDDFQHLDLDDEEEDIHTDGYRDSRDSCDVSMFPDASVIMKNRDA